MFSFGFLGYVLRRYNFAPIAFMIGLFLGRPLDEEMTRFNALFGDDLSRVFDRPITMGLVTLTLISIIFQVRKSFRRQ